MSFYKFNHPTTNNPRVSVTSMHLTSRQSNSHNKFIDKSNNLTNSSQRLSFVWKKSESSFYDVFNEIEMLFPLV